MLAGHRRQRALTYCAGEVWVVTDIPTQPHSEMNVSAGEETLVNRSWQSRFDSRKARGDTYWTGTMVDMREIYRAQCHQVITT